MVERFSSVNICQLYEYLTAIKYYFQNESECFIGVSKHRETNESFIVSRCLDTPIKHEARVLEITSQNHSQTNHKQRLPG